MAEYISFQPSDFFNPKLYTGDTSSSNAITGVGFQPDFTWIKNRDAADFHILTDAVRGATKYLQSNATTAEVTSAESLKSFDSDGFTVGNMNEINTSPEDYVSWNWKAGTTTGIAGSPSITPSSYSFNATSGFSVIAYTGNSTAGATLPHGLGVAPDMIIVKRYNSVGPWTVYQQSLGPTKFIEMNSNGAAQTATTRWNDTSPSSTLFYLGSHSEVNNSGDTYIAYCFASKKGYSKFGSYLGNGNGDGPFIYTGFRPAFFITKSTTTTQNWIVIDDKRYGYNMRNFNLFPNTVDAEVEKANRLVSNGVKMGVSDGDTNGSAVTFMYMAFAAFPLVSSNDVPGVGR